MISTIKEKDNQYYCANCHMKQYELHPQCYWCNSVFDNYEIILLEIQEAKLIEEIKNEGNGL